MEISEYRSSSQLEASRAIQIIRKHEKIIAVILASLLMFLAQSYIGAKKFEGDAAGYWHFSTFIWNYSFPLTIRGYFYPLLLSPSRLIFDAFPNTGYLSLYAMQALVFSFTLTILLPYVFTRLIGGKSSLGGRLLVPFFVAFFFPGLIAYPLSDLPALCLIIASLALIISASKQNNFALSIILAVLAGIAAYGAYNTRTIYLFTIIPLALLVPILILKNKTAVVRSILTLAFLVGSTIAATPQMLINLKHLNSPTPLVISNINNASLFASQLKWGITVQRYETGYDAESSTIFPIYYVDPIGERVFKNNEIGAAYATVPWYFSIFLSDPVSFLKIYTKHFINGIDVRDGDPYTRVRSKEKDFLSIASISISVFGLFCLVSLIFRNSESTTNTTRLKKILPRAIWTLSILLPVLAILPGAIETRYFLPLHLIAYCSIAFGISIQKLKSIPTKKMLLICSAYIAIVAFSYFSAKESISSPVYEVPAEYLK